MKKTASILPILLISILLISACSSQQPIQGGPGTPDGGPTGGGPSADGQKVITLDDQGRTVTLAVGESFLLKLGEVYSWDVSISDQAVLSRVRNIAVVRGAQGIYLANQAGSVTLSAAGDPQCRQSQPPCGMPSMLFEITFIVK
jgi:hypothetical protein